jgi:hypothetical protein
MMVPPFQIDFVLVTAILAGLFMLIPLVGNLLALGPPMIALFLTPGKEGWWPWFLLVLFVMQSIMVNVLSPRIMSSAIGIHPIYVWAAILIGSQVAGIWGVLFGIPIAGAINLIGRPLMRRIRHQTALYRDGVLPSATTASYLTGPLAASLAESKAQFEAAADAANAAVETQPHARPQPSMQPQPAFSAQSAPLQNPGAGRPVTQAQPVAAGMGPSSGPLSMPDDGEDDLPARPSPTLSAKALKWAWARVQSRGSKK